MPAKSSVLPFALCLALAAPSAWAQGIPPNKQTAAGLYVTAAEAAEILADPGVVLLDIRSRSEITFVGLPIRVDVHIPYMDLPMFPEYDPERRTYALEINPDFPRVFRTWAEARGLEPDSPIIVMCRSGSRSARAADLLSEMGYDRVYTMVDGFEGDRAAQGPEAGHRVLNGWRNAGLPWSYTIESRQAYPDDM